MSEDTEVAPHGASPAHRAEAAPHTTSPGWLGTAGPARGAKAIPCSAGTRDWTWQGPRPRGGGHALLNQPWVAGPGRAPAQGAEAIPCSACMKRLGMAGPPPTGRRPYLAQLAWRDWAWQGPRPRGRGQTLLTQPWVAGPGRAFAHGAEAVPCSASNGKDWAQQRPPPPPPPPHRTETIPCSTSMDGWTRRTVGMHIGEGDYTCAEAPCT